MGNWENVNTGVTYYSSWPPKIRYSWKLEEILKKIDKQSNFVSSNLLSLIDKKIDIPNVLNISLIDVSKSDYSFDVTVENNDKKYKKARVETMKIAKFCITYFGKVLDAGEIYEFSKLYNAMKGVSRVEEELDGTPIELPKEFKFNPKDVKSTFISLTTKTYPTPLEEEVLEFLPPGLKKDIVGNYYAIIGEKKPETMFCCHLDTADRIQKDVGLLSVVEKDPDGKYTPEEYILTDGSSILGADDKAGVTVLVYLMAHYVPGLYYFFIGEERGGVGSRALNNNFWDVDYLQNIKRVVAFDRRDYHSIITRQSARVCCSDEFGNALAAQLNKNGLNMMLDTTGTFTDSASFIEDISECTNISVGYMHEHSTNEYQNITYLELLSQACVKVDWDSLPAARRVGVDQEIVRKYNHLVRDLRKAQFRCDVRLDGTYAGVFIKCDLEYGTIGGIYDTTSRLLAMLNKYKVDPEVIFDDTFIKIQLK